ncbi:hypothetical protein FHK92_01925 [Pseudomonas brassicacearum subsp. neoaurantiaca]|uniref:Uncharacterized protein n=1 Tax=Pseudomonas brassicacearum subsp. neoaurantiaca TaxID=494916 RepID=A0A7V8RHJ9_9PSED|nr:hypothetical protein [Pseudomonas brassicacearum subsp. neoaurantiaca]
MGASLLAIATAQQTLKPTDTPPSRASSLPQGIAAIEFAFFQLNHAPPGSSSKVTPCAGLLKTSRRYNYEH